MADLEKLTALKKAYAEIILNTAKEAAARIMVSEKKAARYQRELFAAKDEALRMLLRLKQMLDSKVREAEMASLSQQRRIDELEAQLGEAEDIVKDLRAELRELRDELEVTNNQVLPLGGRNSEGNTATHVAPLEENGLSNIATQAAPLEENQLSTSRSQIHPLPAAHCELRSTLEMKPSTLNAIYNGSDCDSENGSHPENSFVCNTDFAAIVMRSKEPELFRNGCTQRIRAFERSLLGGNLPLSGQCDDAKNQLFITEDEYKHTHKKSIVKADSICDVERRANEVKVMQTNGNCIQTHHIPSFGIKRRRATRYRKHKTSSFPTNNTQSGEDYRTLKNIAQKDPESHISPSSTSNVSEIMKQSGSIEVTKSDSEFRDCMVHSTINRDKFLLDEMELTGLDARCPESLKCPVAKTDYGNCIQTHYIPSSHRKIRRGIRYSKYKKSSFPRSPEKATTNSTQSGKYYRNFKNIAQKDPESLISPTSTSNVCETMKQSGSVKVTKSDSEFRVCMFHNTINHDKLLVDETELTGLDAGSPESLKCPAAKSDYGNCILTHHIPSFRRKIRRATRYRKHKTSSFPRSSELATTNNTQSGKDYRTFENIAQKDPESLVSPTATSNVSEIMKQSGIVEVTKSDSEFRGCMVHNTIKQDKLLVDAMVLTGIDVGSPKSLKCPAAKTDYEGASVLLVKPGPKESNASELLSTQPPNDKFLKYTFQRKRKKESLSSPDRYSSHDTSPLKRKMGEKQSGSQESQCSS